jgi:Ion channel inhibitory toxin
VSQQTTNRSFDELARALAEGSISRRRALKLFAGSALAALIPSQALADDCVRVCHVPFDRETRECDFAKAETRCVSRLERLRHLNKHPCDCRGRCANCLCIPNGDTCSTGGTPCCSGNCSGGKCAAACGSIGATCTSGGDCCSGLVCKGETGFRQCAASCIPSEATTCDPTASSPCSNSSCSCTREFSGTGYYCTGFAGVTTTCTTSCECPGGNICADTGSVVGVCVPVCT